VDVLAPLIREEIGDLGHKGRRGLVGSGVARHLDGFGHDVADGFDLLHEELLSLRRGRGVRGRGGKSSRGRGEGRKKGVGSIDKERGRKKEGERWGGGGGGVVVENLSVVEPVVVDPQNDLLAHVAHVADVLALGLVGGRAQTELGAVGG
jgi:hypothetical protein